MEPGGFFQPPAGRLHKAGRLMQQDLTHLSTLLLRLHDRWWGEILSKQYNTAAYTSNDIEAAGRRIASLTHALNEAQLADSKALNLRHSDSFLSPTKGDSR